MSRNISDTTRADFERGSSSHALLGFLTITHKDLDRPARMVSDWCDYMLDGERYYGVGFTYKLIGDGAGAGVGEIRVPNMEIRDKKDLPAGIGRVGQVLDMAHTRAKVSLEIISSEHFDFSTSPREPIGTPHVEYKFSNFELTDAKVDILEVSGTVALFDPSTEPWPYHTASPNIAPGTYA